MKKKFNWIVFSDLDGTLLDARNYSFSGAQPGIDLLRNRQIPLIPCTSKTYKEVVEIRKTLGLSDPFIVENGSAVFLPKDAFPRLPATVFSLDEYDVYPLGKPYAEVVGFLQEIKKHFHLKLKGFSEMSLREIGAHTNLDSRDADLALQRMFSEPFIADDEIRNFKALRSFALKHGFRLLKGNRFYHLLGATDKGVAVKKTLEFYQSSGITGLRSLGLGDSPNDFEMFQHVNQPVLVKRPSGDYAETEPVKHVFYSQKIGPEGWSEAVLHFIE